ncbi:unnamed protein product, partial [Prorocentrum cordatum]
AARGVGCSQPTLYVLLPRERLLAQGFHTTWRRALAIGFAFSFLGDTRLLEWALESPILAANASHPLSRNEHISPRLSFTECVGLSMSSVHNWSRMYRNTGGGQGEVVLMLMRLYPLKSDMRWIYVRPDRSLGSVDIEDRARITAERQPNATYAHFPALSAEEKTAAIEAGTEKQLSMEFGLVFFAWRAALYFRAWHWAKWAVEKLDDSHTFLMELDGFRAYLCDLYQDGRLELPMLLFSFLMASTPVFWSWCCRRGLPRLGGASPPGSDVDSNGEAGHSVHESDSESEGSKEVSDIRSRRRRLVNIGPLRESLKDLRVRLMEKLTKLKSAPTFELPPGLTARVAPDLSVQTYGKYGSMGKFATDWANQRELYNNLIGHEMLLHCLTLDRMLGASPDFLATAGCEILRSRVYALKRAFEDLRPMSDLKQPRGASANKWKSKDLAARPQQKAPFQKYLHKAGSEGAKVEEEG